MNESFLSINSEGVPQVTADPITTADIDVCPECGCMDLTTTDHHAMFPEKPE